MNIKEAYEKLMTTTVVRRDRENYEEEVNTLYRFAVVGERTIKATEEENRDGGI